MTLNALPFDAIDVQEQIDQMYTPSAVARAEAVFDKLVNGVWEYVPPAKVEAPAVVH